MSADPGLIAQTRLSGREFTADALVWWTGGAPLTGLHDAIDGAHLIGDALRPRRVADAVADAKTLVGAIEARVTASA